MKYLEFEKKYSANTIRGYKSDVTLLFKYLDDNFKIVSPKDINTFHLRSWIFLLNKNSSNLTINRKIASIRHFFSYLEREGVVATNNSMQIKYTKKNRTLPKFIDNKEIKKIVEKLINYEKVELKEKLIFLIIAWTGIRATELTNIKISNINLCNNEIRLEKTKGNKEKVILISDYLRNLIEKYIFENNISKESYLFLTKRKNKLYYMYVYRVVTKIFNLLGYYNKKTPHILRHTLATSLLNNGADIVSIKDILGHSSLNTVQHYTHVNYEKLRKTFKFFHPKSNK